MTEKEDRYQRKNWTEVKVDNLGSRFVRMGGLEKDRFELSTPVTRFLTKALELGVHLKTPQVKQLTPSVWERMVDMVVLYAFGKNDRQNEPLERKFSMAEIGKILPAREGYLTRERVNQLIKKGLIYLYQNSPDDLKQQYPDLLDQVEREHDFMVRPRGATRAVAGVVLTGTTHQNLISRGFSGQYLEIARKILAEYDLSVPYKEGTNKYKKLVEDLKALTGQEEKEQIKQILDSINRYFYQRYREEFETYCLTIADLCQKAGLHRSLKKGHHGLVLAVLDDLGIAYGEIAIRMKSRKQKGSGRINFILAVCEQQAIARLTEDERLKPLMESPISQISGQKRDQLPTTEQLEGKKGYESVGVFLKELGLPAIGGRNRITAQQWLDGCPVAVFIRRSGRNRNHYYPTDQKGQLESFFKSRYQQLRGDLNPH